MARPVPYPELGKDGLYQWAIKLTQYLREKFATSDTIPEVAPPDEVSVGSMLLWTKPAAVPAGWVAENTVVAQAAHAELFALIGATFNTGGEGAGNFRTPNIGPTVGAVANTVWIIKG